jgi:hypothetical protein
MPEQQRRTYCRLPRRACCVPPRPLVRVMHYSDTRPSAPALLPLDPIEDWGVTERCGHVRLLLCSPISLSVSGDGGGLDGKRLMRCDRVRVPGTI